MALNVGDAKGQRGACAVHTDFDEVGRVDDSAEEAARHDAGEELPPHPDVLLRAAEQRVLDERVHAYTQA